MPRVLTLREERIKRCQEIAYSVILLIVCVTFTLALTFESKIARGGMALLTMGIIWVTELVKLELAGLIPIFLYPAAGIMKAKKVIAVKFWKLHSFLRWFPHGYRTLEPLQTYVDE